MRIFSIFKNFKVKGKFQIILVPLESGKLIKLEEGVNTNFKHGIHEESVKERWKLYGTNKKEHPPTKSNTLFN